MDKQFDAVEMKRQGQEAVRDRLKGMTREQQLAYWDNRLKEMQELQRQARDHKKSA